LKTFTPSDIRDLIIPQLRQQADALGQQNLLQAAEVMEYLLRFVEWKPAREASSDGHPVIVCGGRAVSETDKRKRIVSDSLPTDWDVVPAIVAGELGELLKTIVDHGTNIDSGCGNG
jgi:hypothetical protein